ncbi:MAG: hypothetical protein OEV44_11895, partial [Spirochaetota bacterium]|nr:hypothetical protein [Spirochaetota bacterium]
MNLEDSRKHIEKFATMNEKGEIVIDPILDLALIYYVGKDYFVNEETYEEELKATIARLYDNGTT